MNKEEVRIEGYRVFSEKAEETDAVTVGALVTTGNHSEEIDSNHTLRLWILGVNSLGEDVEIVLTAHLFLKPRSIRETRLEGMLFHPLRRKDEKPYAYRVKLELLDGNENIVKMIEDILTI